MSRSLDFERWTTKMHGQPVPCAKMNVSFVVMREDLVSAAALALSDVLDYEPAPSRIRIESARLTKTKVEKVLRDSLRAYGTIFTEFGVSERVIVSPNVWPDLATAAEAAINRLYPEITKEQ